MKKGKYDSGRIGVPLIMLVFFGFLSFPVFFNFHAERVVVYIIFFTAGFVFTPLTDEKRTKRSFEFRITLLILYVFSMIALWFTPFKIFWGILAFSFPTGIFLYRIINEVYKLKRISKRKTKNEETTEEG